MSKYINTLLSFTLILATFSCSNSQQSNEKPMSPKISKSETEWKNELTSEEYRVLREKGTERAFSGEFRDHKEEGIYVCAACQTKLFDSKTKFKSGTGWPSFTSPVSEENIALVKDTSYGMVREEVVCANCGGHLGHVFPDGPEPTGLRYCINSVSLDFEKDNN